MNTTASLFSALAAPASAPTPVLGGSPDTSLVSAPQGQESSFGALLSDCSVSAGTAQAASDSRLTTSASGGESPVSLRQLQSDRVAPGTMGHAPVQATSAILPAGSKVQETPASGVLTSLSMRTSEFFSANTGVPSSLCSTPSEVQDAWVAGNANNVVSGDQGMLATKPDGNTSEQQAALVSGQEAPSLPSVLKSQSKPQHSPFTEGSRAVGPQSGAGNDSNAVIGELPIGSDASSLEHITESSSAESSVPSVGAQKREELSQAAVLSAAEMAARSLNSISVAAAAPVTPEVSSTDSCGTSTGKSLVSTTGNAVSGVENGVSSGRSRPPLLPTHPSEAPSLEADDAHQVSTAAEFSSTQAAAELAGSKNVPALLSKRQESPQANSQGTVPPASLPSGNSVNSSRGVVFAKGMTSAQELAAETEPGKHVAAAIGSAAGEASQEPRGKGYSTFNYTGVASGPAISDSGKAQSWAEVNPAGLPREGRPFEGDVYGPQASDGAAFTGLVNTPAQLASPAQATAHAASISAVFRSYRIPGNNAELLSAVPASESDGSASANDLGASPLLQVPASGVVAGVAQTAAAKLVQAPADASLKAAEASGEKSAVASAQLQSTLDSRRVGVKEKVQQLVNKKREADEEKDAGIESAHLAAGMTTSSHSKAVADASTASRGAADWLGGGLAQLGAGEKANATLASAQLDPHARQLVDRVEKAVATLQGNSERVVRFDVGDSKDERLSVSMQLKNGVIHTTFVSASSEMREVLSREWTSSLAGSLGSDAALRVAEPVFNTAQGRNDTLDTGGNSQRNPHPQQQASQGHPTSSQGGTFHSKTAQSSVAASSSEPSNQPAISQTGVRPSLQAFA